jgi:hypothetical protein
MGDYFYQHDYPPEGSHHLDTGEHPWQGQPTLSHGSTGHILGAGIGQSSSVAHTSADGAGGFYGSCWDTQGAQQSQPMFAEQYYGHGGYPETPAYQTSYGRGYVQYGYGRMQAMPMQWQGEGHATHSPTAASDSSGPGPQDAARRELFLPTFQQQMQTAESNRDGAVGMRRRLGEGRGGGGSQSQRTACSPGLGMTPLSEVRTSAPGCWPSSGTGSHACSEPHRRCWGLGRCTSRWRSR